MKNKGKYCPHCGKEKIKPEYPECRDCYFKKKKTTRKTAKKTTKKNDEGMGIDFNKTPFSVIIGIVTVFGMIVFSSWSFGIAAFSGFTTGILYWYFFEREEPKKKKKKEEEQEWIDL